MSYHSGGLKGKIKLDLLPFPDPLLIYKFLHASVLHLNILPEGPALCSTEHTSLLGELVISWGLFYKFTYKGISL